VLPRISQAAQVVTATSGAQAAERGLRDGFAVLPHAWHRLRELVRVVQSAWAGPRPSPQQLHAQAAVFISSECVNDAFLIVFGAILLALLFDIRSRIRASHTAEQSGWARRSKTSNACADGDSAQGCEGSRDETRG
jgi:hypothetical protein